MEFTIKGWRSKILKILAAACWPYPIFFIEGDNWDRVKHAAKTQKNIVRTSPALYNLPDVEEGQLLFPSAQFDPNQKSRAYINMENPDNNETLAEI